MWPPLILFHILLKCSIHLAFPFLYLQEQEVGQTLPWQKEFYKMLLPVRQLQKESAELEVKQNEQLEEINSGFASISPVFAKEKVTLSQK